MVVHSLLSIRAASWLVLPAFAVHVLEEAPGFTHWVTDMLHNSSRGATFSGTT
jgi:hypothetical protein